MSDTTALFRGPRPPLVASDLFLHFPALYRGQSLTGSTRVHPVRDRYPPIEERAWWTEIHLSQ
jgi:hypothetical protein